MDWIQNLRGPNPPKVTKVGKVRYSQLLTDIL